MKRALRRHLSTPAPTVSHRFLHPLPFTFILQHGAVHAQSGSLPREEYSNAIFKVGAQPSVIKGGSDIHSAAQVILTPDPRMSHYTAWS